MTRTPFAFRLTFATVAGLGVLVLSAGWLPAWVLWVGLLWALAAILAGLAWAGIRARRLDRDLAAALERHGDPAGDYLRRLEQALRIDPDHRRRIDDLERMLDEHGRQHRAALLREAEGEPLEPWAVELTDAASAAVHVVPVDDLVAHVLTGDGCPCGPDVTYVDDDGTSFEVPLVTHHALDGRP